MQSAPNTKAGGWGRLVIPRFSVFIRIKTSHWQEGGCVVTRDGAMQRRIELLRFHGIDRSTHPELQKRGLPHYDIALAGHKFNMMDIQAAIGIHQLPMLDGFIERREQLAKRYLAAFAGWKTLKLPALPEFLHRHAWHIFTPLILNEAAGIDRDTFIERMKAEGIGIGPALSGGSSEQLLPSDLRFPRRRFSRGGIHLRSNRQPAFVSRNDRRRSRAGRCGNATASAYG